MDEMRSLIREVLSEELARLRPELATGAPKVTEETVAIRSSADLNDFARRVLSMAQDGRLRQDILEGRHMFRLAHDGAPPREAHQPLAPAPSAPPQAHFARGMVSERDIAALAQGTRMIRLGKSVRLTPLARDELRRRGIAMERTNS